MRMQAWQIRPPTNYLCHHGRKGQRWHVKNGPPYPLDESAMSSEERKAEEEKVDTPIKYARMRTVITGHQSLPKKSEPNTIIDHTQEGETRGRAFYDEEGWKAMEIHCDNHGNAKAHPYGNHGEHIHYYGWDENGKLIENHKGEIPDDIRKENSDIL